MEGAGQDGRQTTKRGGWQRECKVVGASQTGVQAQAGMAGAHPFHTARFATPSLITNMRHSLSMLELMTCSS